MTLQAPPVTLRNLLWRGLTVAPKYTAITLGGTALWGIMTVVWANLLGQVTDTVVVPAVQTQTVPTQALTHSLLILLGAGLLNAIGVFGRRYGSYVYCLTVQATHRADVALHYLKLPLAWHRAQPAGDLISRVASDGVTATAVLLPLSMTFGMSVMLTGAFIYLATIDWAILLFTAVLIPVLMAINTQLNRRLRPLAQDASAAVGRLTGAINESADAALAVKVLGSRQAEIARITPYAQEVRTKRSAMAKVFAWFDVAFQGIPFLATFAVIGLAVWRLQAGILTTGQVVAITYLLGMIIAPLRVFGIFLQEIPRSLAGLGRIDAVLAVPDRIQGSPETTTSTHTNTTPALTDDHRLAPGTALGTGTKADTREAIGATVTVHQLSYRHRSTVDQPEDTPTDLEINQGVHNLNLTIQPGETIAIVGRTGSGKSTLVSLLAGLLPPDEGEIRIDGIAMADLSPQTRAALISTAFQSPFLFNDSLKDNITLGAAVPDDRLQWAMEVAQVHRFAADIGVNTAVGERGTQLSGGQRQRIALARALIQHPRLLILDDATSAVDATVEGAILAGLRDARAAGHRPTTVMVASRSGTIALADRVVVMAGGRITTVGTHEHLLATNPDYAELLRAVEVDGQ